MLTNLERNHRELIQSGLVLRANGGESYFFYAPPRGNARSHNYRHVSLLGRENLIRLETVLHRGAGSEQAAIMDKVVNARLRRGTGDLDIQTLSRKVLALAKTLYASGKIKAADSLYRRVGKMMHAHKRIEKQPPQPINASDC